MGLFSRKKVATKLEVSIGRVSQLASTGALIEPMEDDESGHKGWPATYVEEVAGRKKGRSTSRSIYSFAPATSPAIRETDGIIDNPETHEQAWVQFFKTNSGHIGVITPLQRTKEVAPPPYKPVLQRAPLYSELGSSELALMTNAISLLNELTIYDVAWVYVRRDDLYEVVISEAPAIRENNPRSSWEVDRKLKTENVSHQTLSTKMGRKIPLIDLPTAAAVEDWNRADKTPITRDLEWTRNFNLALSASILTGLEQGEQTKSGATSRVRAAALNLAVARLAAEIEWDSAGAWAIRPPQETQEHVEYIVKTVEPDLSIEQAAVKQSKAAALTAPAAKRQEYANELYDLIYSKYGKHGDAPEEITAYALGLGITALCDLTIDEIKEESPEKQPRFPVRNDLRSFEKHQQRIFERYCSELIDLDEANSPEARQLLDVLTAEERRMLVRGHGNYELKKDRDGNPVLLQAKQTYDGDPYTKVSVVVPVTMHHKTSRYDHLKNFDYIAIPPYLQDGPIFIVVEDTLHLMPFAEGNPGGFTHGYRGTGPQNLQKALTGFLQWSQDAQMTDEGKERIASLIANADQHSALQITREQVVRPGMYAPLLDQEH